METKYNVYINTIREDAITLNLQHDCEGLTTPENYKKEYPIMGVIPYEYPPNLANTGSRCYHVVMIDIPEVEKVDFISNNHFHDPYDLTSKRYSGKKAFMGKFDMNTDCVSVICYGTDKKAIIQFKIYFLRQEGVGWRCGNLLIDETNHRLNGIHYYKGFINCVFNPWEADETYAYVLVNGMFVDYVKSDGGTNMLSIRNPSIHSESRLMQIKDGKIVAYQLQKAPQGSGYGNGGAFITY